VKFVISKFTIKRVDCIKGFKEEAGCNSITLSCNFFAVIIVSIVSVAITIIVAIIVMIVNAIIIKGYK